MYCKYRYYLQENRLGQCIFEDRTLDVVLFFFLCYLLPISYDIEFKDDNPFPYNALYFVNNELYTYKNNKLNYIMSAEEYANTYYEVVSPQNGIYHVYSINGETVTSVEDFKTQLIAIMTNTETTSIEIIYD